MFTYIYIRLPIFPNVFAMRTQYSKNFNFLFCFSYLFPMYYIYNRLFCCVFTNISLYFPIFPYISLCFWKYGGRLSGKVYPPLMERSSETAGPVVGKCRVSLYPLPFPYFLLIFPHISPPPVSENDETATGFPEIPIIARFYKGF